MNAIKKFLDNRHLTQTSQIIAVTAATVFGILGLPLMAGFFLNAVNFTEVENLAWVSGFMLLSLGVVLSVIERKQQGKTMNEWQSVLLPCGFCALFLLLSSLVRLG